MTYHPLRAKCASGSLSIVSSLKYLVNECSSKGISSLLLLLGKFSLYLINSLTYLYTQILSCSCMPMKGVITIVGFYTSKYKDNGADG